MVKFDPLKQEVLGCAHWLSEHGYLGKTSSGGNISARVPDENSLVITPSGKPYLPLAGDDLCVIVISSRITACSVWEQICNAP